ncbi:ribonuclease III [Patescibacteria group bacterium]|nr:ribonuclease III [Patescibacteria group bacterium]MBU1931726.1 ribonuclease III [Patescibacteria group bacterium]
MAKIASLLTQLNITPNNPDWYQQAFIHRSFLNENRRRKLKSNERLEFLGDAVLELIVSEFLFNHHPDKQEGRLTWLRSKIVQTASLAKIAKQLNFDQYLKVSKGECQNHGEQNPTILANTFEAFLGALYQDQGLNACRDFVNQQLINQVDELVNSREIIDYKSLLQEKAQAMKKLTPNYQVLKSWGPDHNRLFEVAVLIDGQAFAQGKGKSKQQAEQQAAQKALEKMKKIF